VASYYLSGKTFKITSHFGMRTHPISGQRKMHKGLDLAAPRGTPIRAVGPGKVILSQWVSGYGWMIAVKHPDGTISRYAHMNSRSPLRVGATVSAGQVIGLVGSTGNSTGPHLHLEIVRGSKYVNPLPYLQALAAPTSPRTMHLRAIK